MSATVFIVHEDATMREHLRQVVRAQVGSDVVLDLFAAFDPMRVALEGKGSVVRLVVAGASAPAAEGRRPDVTGHTAAKSFVLHARERWPELDLLLLWTEEEDDELRRIAEQHERTRLVVFGPRHPSWKQSLRDCAKVAAGAGASPAPPAQRTQTILNIHLWHGIYGQWSLERRGRVEAVQRRPLKLDPVKLSDLSFRSRELSRALENGDWGPHLRGVAHDLEGLLFDNGRLKRTYQEATRDEQRRQLRLIFGLGHELHCLPVEVLKRRSEALGEEQWHGLNSPMLRQYNAESEQSAGGGREPLFRDAYSRRGPIDCLIVVADPEEGYSLIEEKEYGWPGLPHIEEEARDIASALEHAKEHQGGVGRIDVLRLAGAVDAQNDLMERLAEREWHMVHFAGHSFVHPGATGSFEPYIVLRASGGMCTLRFAALTRVLSSVRFLFLSSCQSADADFLALAVRELIPAIIGYRWNVNDEHARWMAAGFYRALFGGADTRYSLARALLHARRTIFELHPEAPTWASPLLLVRGDAAVTPRQVQRGRGAGAVASRRPPVRTP